MALIAQEKFHALALRPGFAVSRNILQVSGGKSANHGKAGDADQIFAPDGAGVRIAACSGRMKHHDRQ
jgi:hypothetical protein